MPDKPPRRPSQVAHRKSDISRHRRQPHNLSHPAASSPSSPSSSSIKITKVLKSLHRKPDKPPKPHRRHLRAPGPSQATHRYSLPAPPTALPPVAWPKSPRIQPRTSLLAAATLSNKEDKQTPDTTDNATVGRDSQGSPRSEAAMYHRSHSVDPATYSGKKDNDYSRKATPLASLSCPPVVPSPPPFRKLLTVPAMMDVNLDELLTCPVCMEDYSSEGRGGRDPLFLACHHSLCRQCLPRLTRPHQAKYSVTPGKDMGELSCPECRVVTLVPPTGLTQNFYLVSLIEARRKKSREPSSRLRMWCEDCDSVALESCAPHTLTHLTAVLASASRSFSDTTSRLTELLQSRAHQKGEEALELRTAVDHLTRASASLKKQLEQRLDHAELAHATANSLLQEVDQMSRRVGCDRRLTRTVSPSKESLAEEAETTPTPPPPRLSKVSSMTPLSERSKREVGVDVGEEERRRTLRKSRSDVTERLLALQQNPDSGRMDRGSLYPSLSSTPPGDFSSAIYDHSSRSSSSPSSPSGSIRSTASVDRLTCEDKESRISVLRQCVASLRAMEATLATDKTAVAKTTSKSDSQGDVVAKEDLMDMFRRAVDALDIGSTC